LPIAYRHMTLAGCGGELSEALTMIHALDQPSDVVLTSLRSCDSRQRQSVDRRDGRAASTRNRPFR
jgi:hypothetical protein